MLSTTPPPLLAGVKPSTMHSVIRKLSGKIQIVSHLIEYKKSMNCINKSRGLATLYLMSIMKMCMWVFDGARIILTEKRPFESSHFRPLFAL